MLEIKTVTMKNAFGGLIRIDTSEESMTELESLTTETSKQKSKEKKRQQQKYPRTWDRLQRE